VYQERARSFQGAFLLLDALCIGAAFAAAFVLRQHHDAIPLLGRIPQIPWSVPSRSDYAVLFATNLLVWLGVLRRSGLYGGRGADRPPRVIAVYLRALAFSGLATGAVVFALKISPSRLFFAYFYVVELTLLLAKQVLTGRLLRRLRASVWHRRNALVVGAAAPAAWLAEVLHNARDAGYELVGVASTGGGDAVLPDGVRVLGRVEEIDRILASHRVEEAFLVGTAREMARLAPLAQRLIERGRVVSLVSTLSSGADGVMGRITEFDGVPMISYGPMPRDEVQSGLKRTIDVAVSAAGLLLLAPLLALLAAAVRAVDGGPVLFRQQRLGRGGRRFTLLKFRTMRQDAEHLLEADPELHRRYVDNDYKLPEREDPRVSRLGRFLRRSSLDELPQLWNVLKGDMTLVGPRPIVPDELEMYEPYADLFLSVRPGLTGHWQVNGRSAIPYPQRAFMELDYVGRHRVGDDLAIIARTVPAVLRRKGAF